MPLTKFVIISSKMIIHGFATDFEQSRSRLA